MTDGQNAERLILVCGVLVGTVGWASDQGPRVVQWSSAIAAA